LACACVVSAPCGSTVRVRVAERAALHKRRWCAAPARSADDSLPLLVRPPPPGCLPRLRMPIRPDPDRASPLRRFVFPTGYRPLIGTVSPVSGTRPENSGVLGRRFYGSGPSRMHAAWLQDLSPSSFEIFLFAAPAVSAPDTLISAPRSASCPLGSGPPFRSVALHLALLVRACQTGRRLPPLFVFTEHCSSSQRRFVGGGLTFCVYLIPASRACCLRCRDHANTLYDLSWTTNPVTWVSPGGLQDYRFPLPTQNLFLACFS